MKAAGKRQKGSRLERKFAKLLRQYGLDKSAKRMPLSGGDWAFKGDIFTKLPIHFECKNQEKLKIWEWYEKTEADCPINKTPVLVFSSNFRPIMVCLKADDFLRMLETYEK